MANTKIGQLNNGAPAQAADQVPINRGGTNFFLPVSTIGAAGAGTFQGRFVASGITYTPGSLTNKLIVRMVGAGGGGGGITANATDESVAGGGAAGGYIEDIFFVVPSTAYTIAIGAGGTAGTNAGANGGPGGVTSFSAPHVAAGANVTVTANGGAGGVGMTANATAVQVILGGAQTAANSNNTPLISAGGEAGGIGFRSAITAGFSGSGGDGQFGHGGAGGAANANAAGQNGVGFGAGGGGAHGGAAAAGGNGTAGLIVVDEYS